jgi:hypothetical protein
MQPLMSFVLRGLRNIRNAAAKKGVIARPTCTIETRTVIAGSPIKKLHIHIQLKGLEPNRYTNLKWLVHCLYKELTKTLVRDHKWKDMKQVFSEMNNGTAGVTKSIWVQSAASNQPILAQVQQLITGAIEKVGDFDVPVPFDRLQIIAAKVVVDFKANGRTPTCSIKNGNLWIEFSGEHHYYRTNMLNLIDYLYWELKTEQVNGHDWKDMQRAYLAIKETKYCMSKMPFLILVRDTTNEPKLLTKIQQLITDAIKKVDDFEILLTAKRYEEIAAAVVVEFTNKNRQVSFVF